MGECIGMEYTNKNGEQFEILEFYASRDKKNAYTIVKFESGHIVKFPYIDPYRYKVSIINPYTPTVNGYAYLAMTKSESRKLDKQYYRRWVSFVGRHESDKIDEYFHSFANFHKWCIENDIDVYNDYLTLVDKQIVKCDHKITGYHPIKVMRIVPYAKVGIPFDSINEYSRECGISQSVKNLSTLDNIKINEAGDILMRYDDGLIYIKSIGGRVLDESE